mmetsp:Transcript_30339/g.65457  ORF Transcript_30339/g.65457 Transcript_30339/m.65457 type:complete len:311 (-) Transcript_30339:2045-2977(-)
MEEQGPLASFHTHLSIEFPSTVNAVQLTVLADHPLQSTVIMFTKTQLVDRSRRELASRSRIRHAIHGSQLLCCQQGRIRCPLWKSLRELLPMFVQCEVSRRPGSSRISRVRMMFWTRTTANSAVERPLTLKLLPSTPAVQSLLQACSTRHTFGEVVAGQTGLHIMLRWHGIIWRWLHGSVASGYSSHYIIHHLDKDFDLQAEVSNIRVKLLLHLVHIISSPVSQDEEPNMTAGPNLVLLQEAGQQQKNSSISNNPPNIDVARQAFLKLWPFQSLGQYHHLLKDGGDLYHIHKFGSLLHTFASQVQNILWP